MARLTIPAIRGGSAWLDSILLIYVATCSAAFYLGGLGLYLDDWFFILLMRESADQSVVGLFSTLFSQPNLAVRPGQILWLIAFQKLSPDAVWPIHLANYALFVAAILLLHAGLRTIQACRTAAFPVALIYVCLASFTAPKLWLAAQQATLSLLFFAFTFFLLTKWVRNERIGSAVLVPAVFATSVASSLCYELFSFLLPLLPLFVWMASRNGWHQIRADRRFWAATLAASAGFAVTTLFKVSIGIGRSHVPTNGSAMLDFVPQVARLYGEAAVTNFWTAWLFSPRAVLGVATGPYFSTAAIYATAIVMPALLWRMWAASPTRQSTEASPTLFAFAGATAFLLGYVPFLSNFWYLAYPWGPNNRGNLAGALGVALLSFAAYRWSGTRFPRVAKSVLLVLCLSGVFLQVSIGSMWVRASDRQGDLLARLREPVMELEGHQMLLVYGLCPYVGVGPVFAYRGWDLTYALRNSGLATAKVDILTPRSRLEPDGIVVTDDASHFSQLYRYGAFAIFDRADGTLTPINSAAVARAFFQHRSLQLPTGCAYHKETGRTLY